MPDYVFADGPFEGQVLGTRDLHAEGDLMVVELVDVELSPDTLDRVVVHEYEVEHVPADDLPGLLRHLVPRSPTQRLAC